MSFGNNVRGKRVPPPLPMFHPVALKHVPTMVRRRYEHFDVHKLDQHDDEGYLDGAHGSDKDQLEDMGPGEISSEQGSVSEDEGNDDRSDLEQSVCIVEDTYVKAESQDNGLGSHSFNQSLRESKDNGIHDSSPSSEGHASLSVEWQHSGEGNSDDFEMGTHSGSLSNELIQPTDLQTEYSGSEDDRSNVVNPPFMDSKIEDETEDKRLSELNNDLGESIEEKKASYPSVKSEVLGMTDRSFVDEHECHESEDDGSEVSNHPPIVDSNLEGETHDKRVDFSNEQDKRKMSFGNNARGWQSPHPLPMYQPVVLKHVPTMVRRRYEYPDADKDALSNEGESDDDGDLNSSEEDEPEDMGPGYISSEHGLASEDDNNCDQSDMEHSQCIPNTFVKAETQNSALENTSSDPGFWESEANDSQDSNPSSEKNAGASVEGQNGGDRISTDDCHIDTHSDSVGDRSIQPTDLQSEYSESEGDESKVAHHGLTVDSSTQVVQDETLDKRLTDFSYEQDLHSEYTKNEDNESKFTSHAPLVDLHLEHETHHKSLADSSNEQGLGSEDSIGGCDEALDGHPSFCVNASVSSETDEFGHGSINDKQDAVTQIHNEDFDLENFVRTRSLHFKDLKREGEDRPKDMNDATDQNTRVIRDSNKRDFNPEAFTKAVEEDGYELCCPYCKHCITKTLIYRRRENNQQYRITCFTSLFYLFCCVRD